MPNDDDEEEAYAYYGLSSHEKKLGEGGAVIHYGTLQLQQRTAGVFRNLR